MENDLVKEMTDDEWEAVLDLSRFSSPCAEAHVYATQKIFIAPLTKTRLANVFLNLGPLSKG